MDRLPPAHPSLGMEPATRACALTGNRTPEQKQDIFLNTTLRERRSPHTAPVPTTNGQLLAMDALSPCEAVFSVAISIPVPGRPQETARGRRFSPALNFKTVISGRPGAAGPELTDGVGSFSISILHTDSVALPDGAEVSEVG
uniref:Uncharacterized protein n=1 Tax=Myotis myotis TaxID=51298 RepID=A0A7J7RUQ7_MYOMY|nr:hypothetical protein mMyoMyo1_010140 [Myotis myotis]